MNKATNTIFGIALVISMFVTPILYGSWKKEKERASEYQKHFFYLWNGLKDVNKGKATVNDLLEYLNDLKHREERMNYLADELAGQRDDRF